MATRVQQGTASTPPTMESRPVRRVRRLSTSPLGRDVIVSAALRLVDEAGLEALTVRRLGDRLGVTMMALYWHVRDKAELLDLVGEAVMADVEIPSPTRRWADDLVATLRAAHRGLGRHPNAAALALGRARYGPSGLLLLERVLEILRSAGFDDNAAGTAYTTLHRFLLGSWSGVGSVQAGAGTPVVDRDYLASLPADAYPRASAIGPLLARRDPDELFERGLDLVVAGLVRWRETGASTGAAPSTGTAAPRHGGPPPRGVTPLDAAKPPRPAVRQGDRRGGGPEDWRAW